MGKLGGYPGAYNASITNKPTCGGNSKPGLPPTVGVPINILVNNSYMSNKPPLCCKSGKACTMANGYGINNRSVQRLIMIY